MSNEIYRYQFTDAAPMDDVECSLVLSILGAEALHGESQVRLDAAHCLDREKQACVIDARTDVGRDLNRLFVGFLQREFEEGAFQIKRVRQTDSVGELAGAAG